MVFDREAWFMRLALGVAVAAAVAMCAFTAPHD
jgi:hypothetical protein